MPQRAAADEPQAHHHDLGSGHGSHEPTVPRWPGGRIGAPERLEPLAAPTRKIHRMTLDPTDPTPTTGPRAPACRCSTCGLWAGVGRRLTRCAASVDLARTVERLGFTGFWVAEHHNMPGIASASPPVLIAHVAADDRPSASARAA